MKLPSTSLMPACIVQKEKYFSRKPHLPRSSASFKTGPIPSEKSARRRARTNKSRSAFARLPAVRPASLELDGASASLLCSPTSVRRPPRCRPPVCRFSSRASPSRARSYVASSHFAHRTRSRCRSVHGRRRSRATTYRNVSRVSCAFTLRCLQCLFAISRLRPVLLLLPFRCPVCMCSVLC